METPLDTIALPDRRAIRAQRRRAFTALTHRQRAIDLRTLAVLLVGTMAGIDAKQKAWRHLYRADAWQALAEGDAALARSLHRAAIRPAARAFA